MVLSDKSIWTDPVVVVDTLNYHIPMCARTRAIVFNSIHWDTFQSLRLLESTQTTSMHLIRTLCMFFVYLSPLCIAANLSLSRFCWLHADCARWFICLWSKHGLCANMQFVLFFPSGQPQTGSFHNHILMPVKATAFLLQSKKPGLQSPSQHTNQEKGGWLNSVCSSANILKGLHSPPWCWMHLHLFL